MSTRKLQQSRIYIDGGLFSTHQVKVPHGTTLEDLVVPEFWAHVAKQLREHDIINVVSEDHSFRATLHVLQASDNAVSVRVYGSQVADAENTVGINDAIDLEEDAYDIEFNASDKWRAVRKSDRKVVVSGYAEKRQAEYALSELLQRLASAA